MPEEINQEIEALQELVSILERSQEGLEKAGLSAESLTNFIDDLNAAIEGTISVLPQLEQILSVITKIESGEGGRERLAGIGQRRLDLATKGKGLYEEQQEIEIQPLDTKQIVDSLRLVKEEIDKLSDVELDTILEDIRRFGSIPLDPSKFRELGQAIKDLESGEISAEDLGIDPEEFEAGVERLLEIVEYIPEGTQDAIDALKSITAEIDQMDDISLEKVSEEFEKISDIDTPIEELKELSEVLEALSAGDIEPTEILLEPKELDQLIEALDRVKESYQIDTSKSIEQLDKLLEALNRIKAEIGVRFVKDPGEIIDKVGINESIESIENLKKSLSSLRKVDLSDWNLTDELDKLKEIDTGKIEEIQKAIEELKSVSGSIDPFEFASDKEIQGFTESLKLTVEEINKLDDTELEQLSDELEKISGIRIEIKDWQEFEKILKELSSGEISFSETISINELNELIEALDKIKVSSQDIDLKIEISDEPLENLRILQQEIEKLDADELTKVTEKFKELSGTKISVQTLKELQQVLKELESGKIEIKDLSITNDQIKQLLESLLKVKSIDFSGSEKLFARFASESARMVKSSNEAAIQIDYLREKLKGLGVEEAEINKVASSLEQLGKFRVRDVFTELEKLDLPEEELRKFANEFVVLSRNSAEIEKLSEKLKSLRIPQDSIDEIVKAFASLGIAVQDIDARMGRTTKSTQELIIPFSTGAGASDKFSFSLDKVTRSIVDTGKAATQTKPALREFVEGLKDIGVPRVERRKIVEETFGVGATDTSKIRITPLDDGVRKLTTTLQIGEKATQAYSVTIDELGQKIEDAGQKAAKSPLRQFAEGLKAAGAPREVRRQIIEETSGQGIEGITGTRVTELDKDITKLNSTLKLGGDITKAYVIYWDEFGQTMDRLKVEDTTVSIKDFTDQLSGRVGAIENVTKMVEKYGYSLEDLKGMSTEASTGITKLDFAMKEQDGVTEKLTLHVTEFGKVLTDTQRRFRTFAGGIMRNVGHSFQWAIAITAVYGPLRKLQDLIQLSIENESNLADIGTVLGKNTSELQGVFMDAAGAAQATGESLNGVIEGYALAYRATGSYVDQVKRAEVANQLLIDSLVLSKLSSLEQAEAMDTLVAGLLQVGLNLDQGKELLNKWMAVSKAANVSIDTLASSFAIMATAAEGVGLEFDELNAIVAVVAANTELSATQAGNAVRAFVSGFQTNNAREELAKFGISVDSLSGDARDFMSVMYEIQEAVDAGLISEAELNRIGTALGGRGARRGAQFTTFLKNLDKVQGLVTVSAEAQADAYDALDIKMNTVQTAITNLATSFQVLSNAVGTEGGVLDLLKGLLSILTDITEAATKFVEVMGKAAPLLVVGGGLLAYGASTGRVQQLPSQFGTMVGGIAGGISGKFGGQLNPLTGQAVGNTIATTWKRRATAFAPYLGLLMAEGLMLGINIKDKDWDGLGGQIGGGILGFLVGGPLGAIIGSTIGESFINAATSEGASGVFTDLFEGVLAKVADDEDDDDDDLTRAEEIAKRQGEIQAEYISAAGGEFVLGLQSWVYDAENVINKLVGRPEMWDKDMTGAKVAGARIEKLISVYDTEGIEAAREAVPTQITSGMDDEELEKFISKFKEYAIESEKLEESRKALGAEEIPEGTVFYNELADVAERYADILGTKLISLQEEFRTELLDGELTTKAYNEALERLGTDGEAILQIFTALKDVMGDSAETILLVADVVSRTSQEEIVYMSVLRGAIADLEEQIKDLKTEGDLDLAEILTGDLDAARFELEQYFNQVRTKQREPLIQLQKPVEFDIKPSEAPLVKEEAMRLLEERLQEHIRLGLIPDNTTIEEFLASGEIMAVLFGEMLAKEISHVLDFFPEAIENLRAEEVIEPPTVEPSRFKIQTVDMTQGAFQAAYQEQLAFLQQSFGDYWTPTFETMGIIFSDGVDVLHLDNLAMQLAMNDLIDVNQKQLEGVYNLPTDASFYVPFQGYKLGFGEEGGMGGAATDLSGSATELNQAAQELKGAALALALEQPLIEQEERLKKYPPGTDQRSLYPWPETGGQYGRPAYSEQFGRFEQWPETGGRYGIEPEITEPTKFETTLESIYRQVDSIESIIGQEPYDPEAEKIPILENLSNLLDKLFGVETVREQIEQPRETELSPFFNALEKFSSFLNSLFGAGDVTGVGIGAGLGSQLDFTKINNAATSLENVATILQPQLQPLGPAAPFGTGDVATEFSGVLDALNQKISNLSGFTTNLKISSSYTANLIVDGRTLAQVIKPYLYTDLIRFEDSASSVTKTIVV